MNDQWIKFSDREPTKYDYPIWAESPEWGDPQKPRLFYTEGPLLSPDCIAPRSWMPAKLPAPPPKEKTQKELDAEAFYDWWRNQHPTDGYYGAWRAALAWERKEVGAILKVSAKNWSESTNAQVLIPASDYAKLCKRIGL